MTRLCCAALMIGVSALACGEARLDDQQQTDGWVDTSTQPIPLLGEGGEVDESDYMVWSGYLTLAPDRSELVGDVLFWADLPNMAPCVLWFGIESSTPLDDCPDCKFAFELTYTDPYIENGYGCPKLGIDPDSLAGMTQTIGYAGGDDALTRVNGTWIVGGEARHDGEYWFEFELLHELVDLDA